MVYMFTFTTKDGRRGFIWRHNHADAWAGWFGAASFAREVGDVRKVEFAEVGLGATPSDDEISAALVPLAR